MPRVHPERIQPGMTDPYINETVTYVAEVDKKAIRKEIWQPFLCFLIFNLILGIIFPVFCIIPWIMFAVWWVTPHLLQKEHRCTSQRRHWSTLKGISQLRLVECHSSNQYCNCGCATTWLARQYKAYCTRGGSLSSRQSLNSSDICYSLCANT